MAIGCGDTFVLKPAEHHPSSATHIAELAPGGAKNHAVVMPDAVIAGLRQEIARMKVGPGTAPGMDMGPLVTKPHFDKVGGYVDQGVKEGASFSFPSALSRPTPARQRRLILVARMNQLKN